MTLFADFFKNTAKPIIGMVHLLPLPGSAQCSAGDHADKLGEIEERAVSDAIAIESGGAHGVMIENFGDVPFFKGRVPVETVASLTRIASAVRRATTLPLGINVLRNDGQSALAIAQAVGGQFIRVNVLCGARVTDQGVIEGIAADLLRDRRRLGCLDIAILADVDVKHSTPLSTGLPIEQEVADTLRRGMADALIVSGSGTGQATDVDQIRRVKSAANDAPVLIGSGVTIDTIQQQLAVGDGAIVGTSIKEHGHANNIVNKERVRALVAKAAG